MRQNQPWSNLQVRQLAEEKRFDYLVIESTGISEPLPVAETFTFADSSGRVLSDVASLDTMVTVSFSQLPTRTAPKYTTAPPITGRGCIQFQFPIAQR